MAMRLRSEMITLIRKIHQQPSDTISDADYEEVMYASRDEIAAAIPEATEADLDRIMQGMRERFARHTHRTGERPAEGSPTIN